MRYAVLFFFPLSLAQISASELGAEGFRCAGSPVTGGESLAAAAVAKRAQSSSEGWTEENETG